MLIYAFQKFIGINKPGLVELGRALKSELLNFPGNVTITKGPSGYDVSIVLINHLIKIDPNFPGNKLNTRISTNSWKKDSNKLYLGGETPIPDDSVFLGGPGDLRRIPGVATGSELIYLNFKRVGSTGLFEADGTNIPHKMYFLSLLLCLLFIGQRAMLSQLGSVDPGTYNESEELPDLFKRFTKLKLTTSSAAAMLRDMGYQFSNYKFIDYSESFKKSYEQLKKDYPNLKYDPNLLVTNLNKIISFIFSKKD